MRSRLALDRHGSTTIQYPARRWASRVVSGKVSTSNTALVLSNRRSMNCVSRAHTMPSRTRSTLPRASVSLTSVKRTMQSKLAPGSGWGPWKSMRSMRMGSAIRSWVVLASIQ
jgi:hypothetical protein